MCTNILPEFVQGNTFSPSQTNIFFKRNRAVDFVLVKKAVLHRNFIGNRPVGVNDPLLFVMVVEGCRRRFDFSYQLAGFAVDHIIGAVVENTVGCQLFNAGLSVFV